MRSYHSHLATFTTSPTKSHPIFRSSAIFPVFHLPGISSRILFMGYWLLKRKIPSITCVITLRSQDGSIIYRATQPIQEIKSYAIELEEIMEIAQSSAIENSQNQTLSEKSKLSELGLPFIGSIEVEFYSIENLVLPYPATTVNYYGPNFSSVVHTAQRVYNDYQDMKSNSQFSVPEAGFNIYANEKISPFISFINGCEEADQFPITLHLKNSFNENLTLRTNIGKLNPYQTSVVYLNQLLIQENISLSDFLKGQPGTAKLKFHLKWIFPRIIVGNMDQSISAMSITHTYYDCTQADHPSDYWKSLENSWHAATLLVPVRIEGSRFTKIYFYPIYSPSHFAIDVEIYSHKGEKLGSKNNVIEIAFSKETFQSIDVKNLAKELNIQQYPWLALRIIARNKHSTLPIPSRIKLGFDIGASPDNLPCNICTNLQPFNPMLENKPQTFRWAPFLADQPYPTLWILNSSQHINYQRDAEVSLTFYREQDHQKIEKKITISPHGFEVVTFNDYPELKEFFNGRVGWATAISSNPYINTFYFAEHPSGCVGGDHGY